MYRPLPTGLASKSAGDFAKAFGLTIAQFGSASSASSELVGYFSWSCTVWGSSTSTAFTLER